jgi:hypothetical protein
MIINNNIKINLKIKIKFNKKMHIKRKVISIKLSKKVFKDLKLYKINNKVKYQVYILKMKNLNNSIFQILKVFQKMVKK